MLLHHDHIDYIIKDLHKRGIVADGIQEELIDHICSAVEIQMSRGIKFLDAYHTVLHSFGHNAGLQNTQQQSLQVKNQNIKLMLRNYLTIAIRNLRKQSFYSIINVAGLAVGIAACLVIVLFIIDELGYDKYNTKAGRIYRINSEIKYGGNYYHMTTSAAPMASALREDYPEIESTVRFRTYAPYLVKTAEGVENIKEENVWWTDSTFFEIFSVRVLEGDPRTALRDPASIAISKRTAEKYFPQRSALGQYLILDNNYHAKVTAVFENMPAASHFHFDILISVVGNWAPVAKEANSTVFFSNNFTTYVLLREGADPKAFEAKLPGFLKKYVGPQLAKVVGGDFTMEKFKAGGNMWELSLMPLLDIHLHSDLKGEFEQNGSMTYVYLLGTVALFILTIACINFMNLSTARSSNRAKEVGVRKVMGSLRIHLVRQFLTESILVTLLAFILSVGIALLFLPLFNDLALKQLSIPFTSATFYLSLAAGVLVIGILAGVYPSFFLSAFKPVNVLKGRFVPGTGSGFTRSALVVFQFVISIFLIIGATTINRQLKYIQNKKLGFSKDQVIVVHDAYALRPNKVQTFKEEVLKNSNIKTGTITGFLPVEGNSYRNDNPFWKEGAMPAMENAVSLQEWAVDNDYVETLGMSIKLGRGFSADFPSDSSAVVLNEAAVQQFEFGTNPLGKKICTINGRRPDGLPDPDKIRSWTVIGVVENFHFSNMREGITSLGLFLNESDGNVSFRFSAKDTQEIILSIEKVWNGLAPDQPFQYSFLDEDFGRMYAAEQRLGKTFAFFAGLAIVIACLGLFALTAFTAEQRTKEIGIRKVLGASVSSIVMLLSKEFGKLILIAFILASPIAWYGIDWWLKSYAYKTEIGITVYVLAGISALIIAWITMGYQSIKAATSDPVKSLRSE